MKITVEEWPLVEHVLDELDGLDGLDRGPALERLCAGRPELRATVERLLDAEKACESDGFLEQPAAALAAPMLASRTAVPPPATIGPFRVLREVGRGGYGTVYLAEREGVGQRVAVKVLRSDAGRGARRRFAREQRLLAALDHPSIPRLIDRGRTESGDAFLAMEFVEGEPITAYATRKGLGLNDRLRLFLQACEAVRYAHARLVVHRDIKPQNVLVGDGDRKPIVKVVDFGIAKPLAPQGDSITRTGPSAPLTLAYAAPEQLRGEAADPSSDVYALGLLLFALLADRLPHDLSGKSRRAAEQMLLEADTPRPSSLTSATWARRVRGDLDHVVLKALEKDPTRRYRTADALYADIERFLDGVPVAARRPSVLYAAWRIAWRRRAAVLGAVVALVAAGATYAVGLSRQRTAALRAAEERAVVAEVLADVLGAMEGAPESSPTADVILERATQAIRARLGPRPGIEAELLNIVASQYAELGRWDDASYLFGRAVELESRTAPHGVRHANALVGYGASIVSSGVYPSQETLKRAATAYRTAWSIYTSTLGAGSPSHADVLHNTARIHYISGSYVEALRLSTRATRILTSAHADSAYWNRIYANHAAAPSTPLTDTGGRSSEATWIRDRLWYVLIGLGNAQLNLGYPSDAARSFEIAASNIRLFHPYEHNTAALYTNLGDALWTSHQAQEAERAYRISLHISRRLYGSSHHTVARAVRGISASRYIAGDLDSALRFSNAAFSIARRSRDTLMIVYTSLSVAALQTKTGQPGDALLGLDSLLTLLGKITGSHPDMPGLAVGARAERSSALLALGRLEEAELEGRRAFSETSTARNSHRGLAGTAYAEALAARGNHRKVIVVLEPLLSTLWAPPLRNNPRPLHFRITMQLHRSYLALGDSSTSRYYRDLATRPSGRL